MFRFPIRRIFGVAFAKSWPGSARHTAAARAPRNQAFHELSVLELKSACHFDNDTALSAHRWTRTKTPRLPLRPEKAFPLRRGRAGQHNGSAGFQEMPRLRIRNSTSPRRRWWGNPRWPLSHGHEHRAGTAGPRSHAAHRRQISPAKIQSELRDPSQTHRPRVLSGGKVPRPR
jgi:hypothetical protein